MSRHNKRHRFQTILALDAFYLPMGEMARRKALKAISTGRAHAIDLRTWAKLGLADVACMPFSAIVFPRVKAVPEVKLLGGRGAAGILKRDGHVCQYGTCTRRGTTVDHVVPRCQGGQSTWSNQVACCPQCNALKGGRTPEQAGMVLKSSAPKSPRGILLERMHLLAGTSAQ